MKIKGHKRISFDEAITNSGLEESRVMERPINSSVFAVFLWVTMAISVLMLARTFSLGLLNGNSYEKRALANVNKEILIPAPRGIITDRFNKPLTSNKPVLSVFLKISDIARYGELQSVLDAATGVLRLEKAMVLDSINVAINASAADVKISEDITGETAITIKDLGLNSVLVEQDYKREYLDPSLSHVIGYVGLPTREEMAANPEMTPINNIGKSGLELYYDNELRGLDGKKVYLRTASLQTKDVNYARAPEIGGSLGTTIDYELQKYFYASLKKNMAARGQRAGVGIVLDPRNGEVLALLSIPSFEQNKVSEYLTEPNQPLFNRAVSGAYNPGSTIKPVHAVAALKENVIGKNTEIFSRGWIEVPNPYNPDLPTRFVDWKPQGWVDVYSALARSSNVYFYAVGGGLTPNESSAIVKGDYSADGLGIEQLIKYWQRFGFSNYTGVDLPGENKSPLPDPVQKEARTKTPWRIGDTYNVSIGQGDLLITPLQLINTIAAIANGGRAYTPHINLNAAPDMVIDVSDLLPEITEVQRGMKDAVYKPYGTANTLSGLPFNIWAKTGSAQVSLNTKTNALVVGYGSVDSSSPQIAILVLVEDAKEGSLNALPIARDVLEWYYDNRLKKD